MLTIAPGIVPPIAREEWWHGREAQCPHCSTRVKLEPADSTTGAVNPGAERHPGGKQWVEIQCPTAGCARKFTLEKINPPIGEKT
jgi:hypothetical protein